MSSIATRLWTNSIPSRENSSPASPPSRVERSTRRESRTMTSTATVPATAEEKRQPNGVLPNRSMPAAIIHLPSGGWTTKSGWAASGCRIAFFSCSTP